MFGWSSNAKARRRQAREQRAKTLQELRAQRLSRIFSWPTAITLLFAVGAVLAALLGDDPIGAAIGERLDTPVYAKVDFQVEDKKQTDDARRTAQAKTPSYYVPNAAGAPYEKIRANLLRIYQAALSHDTFEAFVSALEPLKLPADRLDRALYDRLRRLVDMPDDQGRAKFESWVSQLNLETQYVVADLARERREPSSDVNFILSGRPVPDGALEFIEVPHKDLVPQDNNKALRGSAADVARTMPAFELRPVVEAIVLAAFTEQPTLTFDGKRTEDAMKAAAEGTPAVMVAFPKGKPFVQPGIVGTNEIALLKAHHAAYLAFIARGTPEASVLRHERQFRDAGLALLVAMIAIATMVFARLSHPSIFEQKRTTIAFATLLLGTVVATQVVEVRWPQLPALAFAPAFLIATVLPIVYPRFFAVGAAALLALLVATASREQLGFFLTLLTGVTIAAFQLSEIRSRTKLITAGAITAFAVMIAFGANGLMRGHDPQYIKETALTVGICASLASFVVSGLLPFIERLFGIATALTLLEWRDPTKPLLQLLAREAPGTYNHSLVLGTLAEAACKSIDANGLLAQVGALYHDVGKIHKSEYFTENQEGGSSRHENLAPTMSLLIILGHVKDGLELAKQYRLPRSLWPFITEHHGTTVVRYFHHVASEKQPQVCSGRHDREVSEAEFRYAGPKPRTKEAAVLMLCDGVEGAVRSLPEPTVGRIESIVHQLVSDRLNDGQFDDCDITLREINTVADSLVKTLCSIYHSRIAYPKTRKPQTTTFFDQRKSV